MDTLFHIGMAKTGSSALQRALFCSAEHLDACGVLYPRDPARPKSENHRLFAITIAPLSKLPRHMKALGGQEEVETAFAAFHAAVAELIAVRKPRLLLLSSETMFSTLMRGEHQGRLRAALDGLEAEPNFTAYVRQPSLYYLSDMQQVLLLRAKLLQPQSPRYRSKIQAYETAFGRRRISLHLYNRSALKGGDIIADFCARYLERFGVDAAKLARDKPVNASLSAESMTIMHAFRRDFHADREDQKTKGSTYLRRLLRAADLAVGAPKPRLRQEIADAIDGASQEALWLRDEYGVVFPNFDYRRLERGRLTRLPTRELSVSEIAVVDPSIRKAIIDHVDGHKWTDARRRRWLAEISAEI